MALLTLLRLAPSLLVLGTTWPLLRIAEFRFANQGVAMALMVLVVLSNLTLVPLPVRAPALLSSVGLLVFVGSGALLWMITPVGGTVAVLFWAARVAVRYQQPRVVGLVAVGIAIVGAGLPFLVFDNQPVLAAGMGASVLVLVLAATNRRAREEQLEQAEVSLARKQTAIEEHTRAAALAERARIAREVHDVLAHSLAGLSLNLQGARLMLVRDGASQEAVDQVTRAQKLAADGLAEARRAVAALREDTVPDERAIADLVTAFRLESGAAAEFAVHGTPRALPAEAATALYRTAQEALTNARKHAPGAPVRAELDYQDGRTVLTVADRPGRPAPTGTKGGYGLLGMRERAELIGGQLWTGPKEDGWEVRLVVPA
ncbi:hypothetical protein KALB_6921 [Kutzneria albida DSM 43870]|uniref:histidine kinase n=1 Tax=Kutzneria albida DSM 43870 TaxID=1449976 RepID=W5WQ24_9PSEU|nr:hypothetical protein KALB_6921 [Kutzneria albida DSM 43870]